MIYLLPESGGRLPDGSRVLLQVRDRKDRSDGYSKYLFLFEPQASERMTSPWHLIRRETACFV